MSMDLAEREKSPAGVAVLLVDDEENILRSLKRLFLDEDFRTLTAGSGAEGLQMLEANRNVGLIVSDQRMPGMQGVDFLRETIRVAPSAMRILLTGHADINASIDAINKGKAYRYITISRGMTMRCS